MMDNSTEPYCFCSCSTVAANSPARSAAAVAVFLAPDLPQNHQHAAGGSEIGHESAGVGPGTSLIARLSAAR